ncbi:MAG: hypothetical protein M0037_00545 [Betaproteobacteria bacterium]|nr:hypothetical protein [Betaproteobacteria bacterium]
MTTDTAEQRAQRLAAGRAKLREQGITPRQRGREKLRLAVDWIYRWGYSSPSVLDILSGAKRAGFPAKLVKNNLCARTKTQTGGLASGIPVVYLTLTELGLSEAERFRKTLINYNIDPYRVDQTKMRHDLIAQKATAKNLQEGIIADYQTERELAAKHEAGQKEPDVVWIMPDGSKTAVEIELTAKWDRRLDEFVLHTARSLISRDGKPPRFDQVAVVSDSPAILERYETAFRPGAKINQWAKDRHGHYRINKTVTMPPEVSEKMLWIALPDD